MLISLTQPSTKLLVNKIVFILIMQTLLGRTTIINSINQAKTKIIKLKSKISFGKIIAFGVAQKIIIGGAFLFFMMAN